MNILLPFASKELPNGKKLYRRLHGQIFTLAASGNTTVNFTVPYAACKFNEVQLAWFPEGVTADFKVLSGDTVLAQHSFGAGISKDWHVDNSNYDADLVNGLTLRFTFTNASATEKSCCVNYVLHEVV